MGENDLQEAAGPVGGDPGRLAQRQLQLSRRFRPRTADPVGQVRQGSARRRRQIQAGRQLLRLSRRILRPDLARPVAQGEGGAETQAVGDHARQVVSAIQLRQQFRLVAGGAAPQPPQHRRRKAETRQAIGAGLKQRQQGPEGDVAATPIQRLDLDHVAQVRRPVARHRSRQPRKLRQNPVRTPFDQLGQGGPLGDRQVRHSHSSGRTDSRPRRRECAVAG
ncbi:hypothetical protein BDIM_01250 [Brevundimonas diminuta ATCC 11568]|nr:hypothetical protein BDIM_01250 [Brevundimonas diminuta ATCC 11568]